MKNNTFVGNAVRIIGWIVIVVGLFVGYMIGNYMDTTTYQYHENWPLVIVYWAASVGSGSFFIALSEIIRMLNSIQTKIHK